MTKNIERKIHNGVEREVICCGVERQITPQCPMSQALL